MRRIVGAALLAALAAGCTVGPNYVAAPPSVPAAYTASTASADPGDLGRWWQVFGDPELDRLIAIAIADNPDVKTAASRIRQARLTEAQARAGLFPTLDATGNVNHIEFSKNAGISSLASMFGGGGGAGAGGGTNMGGIALPGSGITTYSVGFDASWELDVFGGVRRQIEGARARVAAAEWDARDALVSLTAEVADDYLRLRAGQRRLKVAQEELARQRRSLEILQNTAKSGLVPEGNFIRQRTQLATSEAAIGPIETDVATLEHDLSILLARAPGTLGKELDASFRELAAPPAVPPGLPSALLRRRPDVRAAERRLAAATADIGVAVADLYPRFNLTGMAELISSSLTTLLQHDSFQGTGNAAVTFPLLDFGRRRAIVNSRREDANQAYLSYQKTVLGALRDVEDALVRIRVEQARNAALRAGAQDAIRAVQATRAQYEVGLTDFTAVLDAQQQLLQTADQLASSDGQLRQNLASLYKALGGGWQATAPEAGA